MQKGVIMLLSLALLISACATLEGEPSAQGSNGEKQYEKKQVRERQGSKSISKEMDQPKSEPDKEVKLAIAQEANQIALRTKGVVQVASVALDDQLSLAVDVSQMQRWNLKNIRKEIFHHLRDRFPELDIHVSSDRKIFWELQKLEKEMYASNPDVESIEKN